MHSVRRNVFSVSILLSLLTAPLFAAPIDKAALVGSWDYTTYTMLKKGKPVGTVQFKPRTMVFTYNDDGAWQMQADDATHTHRNGTYELAPWFGTRLEKPRRIALPRFPSGDAERWQIHAAER